MFKSESLPVDTLESEIGRAAGQGGFVLTAPTGSGKSTRVPVMLHKILPGKIWVLEPRVLAARLLCRRVSEELGTEPGTVCGFLTRHEKSVNKNTAIIFITEGLFLRLCQNGVPPDTGAVIFDEFHERNLASDLALSMVRKKVTTVVMSATIEAERITAWLGTEHLRAESRNYPVNIGYLPPKPGEPIWQHAVRALEKLLNEGASGNVLIFMPGVYEINRTVQVLREFYSSERYSILRLFGDMEKSGQEEIFTDSVRRKIIVSTNIAETSLTLDNIGMVIDSGLVRMHRFFPGRGVSTLLVENCSRASSDQRSGRAGRTMPGKAIRLWSEKDHALRPAHTEPEIRRVDMAETCLFLRAAGIEPAKFEWFEEPLPSALAEAETLLIALGALDEKNNLTVSGRAMAESAMHPRLSRMVFEAEKRGAKNKALLFAAIIEDGSFCTREFEPDPAESDFELLGKLLCAAAAHNFTSAFCSEHGILGFRAVNVLRTYRHYALLAGETPDADNAMSEDSSAAGLALLSAYPDMLCVKENEGHAVCRLSDGRSAEISKNSCVRRKKYFIAAEYIKTSGRANDKARVNLCSAVSLADIHSLFGGELVRRQTCLYYKARGRVSAEESLCFRGLVLQSSPADPVPDAASLELARAFLDNEFVHPGREKSERYLCRLRFLSGACPEFAIPVFDRNDMMVLLSEFFSGATSVEEIQDRDLTMAWRAGLDYRQMELLDKHAPESIKLENGTQIKIIYDCRPTARVVLQKLYGVHTHPEVGGKVKVLLDILAPNQRTVQKTDDLAGFWKGAYVQIRKELAGRYPKHKWI
ncbi:MAG TPA: hypothetical protein DC049_18115 [Spirochaetia bacterium]|nr:hypothetical protein [Spirochaetia bacterium]